MSFTDHLRPQLTHTFTQLNDLSLRQLLGLIDDPRFKILLRIYDDHADLFHIVRGSSHNHQAWPGGYADHLADMYRLGWPLYAIYQALFHSREEAIPFTLGSAQVVVFTHDAEKLFKYAPPDHPLAHPYQQAHQGGLDWDTIKNEFILPHWAKAYGLTLTPEEENAHQHIHGETERTYRKDHRVMNELAAFCHQLDSSGARLLHSTGKGLSLPPWQRLPADA